jgi:hypothetical protein
VQDANVCYVIQVSTLSDETILRQVVDIDMRVKVTRQGFGEDIDIKINPRMYEEVDLTENSNEEEGNYIKVED